MVGADVGCAAAERKGNRLSPGKAQREFWLRPKLGLSNRLRALLSAIGFCELAGRELVVTWPLTQRPRRWPLRRVNPMLRFGARLSDLWTPSFRVASEHDWQAMLADPASEESALPPTADSDARVTYLETYYAFFEVLPHPPAHYLPRLPLIPRLARRLEEQSRRLLDGRPNIGVHMRTTAVHRKTAEASPVEWFVDRIDALSREHPGASFFLSCDSAETSREMQRWFPGLVREQSRPPGYNTRRGIQKGLLDLLLLARCDHIVGSYWSSLSEMAYHLQARKSYEDGLGSTPSSQPPLESLTVESTARRPAPQPAAAMAIAR